MTTDEKADPKTAAPRKQVKLRLVYSRDERDPATPQRVPHMPDLYPK